MTVALRRILVPLDLGVQHHPQLEWAAHLARTFGARLELFFVWMPPQYLPTAGLPPPLPWGGPDGLEEVSRREAARELTALAEGPLLAGLEVGVATAAGDPAEAILAHAAQGGVDLVVMATHGRRGLARLFLGSVAQRVVARAHCPVLTLHPGEAP